MTASVKGHLKVEGVLSAHRQNAKMLVAVLSAAKALTANAEQTLKLSASSAQDVILPDATTLDNGWEVEIFSTGTANLLVKTYHPTTPVLLQTIAAGEAYRIVLLDNSTATGSYKVIKHSTGSASPAARLVQTFNGTTDWGSAVGGYYSITVTAATHGMGVNVRVDVDELVGSDYKESIVEVKTNSTTGDVTITVPDFPDARFGGRAVFY